MRSMEGQTHSPPLLAFPACKEGWNNGRLILVGLLPQVLREEATIRQVLTSGYCPRVRKGLGKRSALSELWCR